jgi:Abnormal spindle-like microcephaly-assoc'd, ASPM-SPD-2-Hydin
VVFKPTQIGPRNATLTITDNAPDSPQLVVLNGTGLVSGANATLSASSLTFSTQVVGTSSTAQSITLTNSGSAALSITNVSFNGADPGDFSQTNTCGTSLAPGANCSISITFTPKLEGTRSAALALADDAAGNPQLIALSGTGTVVQLNPASLLFVVPPGQSASRSTTLTNVGSTTLSINGITLRGPGVFQLTNTCGSSVAAGKSCSISVTFKPPARGPYSADVYVYDNGGGSPQDVHLYGLGCRNILCR